MKSGYHLEAFEERKETIMKWGVEVWGIDNSQRIVGDNASKAITELLSARLHRERKIDEGFQINHTWFKSERVLEKLPEFRGKKKIIMKMIELERLCESLSYGIPKPAGKIKDALKLFRSLEEELKEMM